MKLRKYICLFLVCLLLTGCAPKSESRTFFAMDTVMSISVYGKEGMIDDLQARVLELESLLSVTDPSSEIYRLNREKHTELSIDTRAAMEEALHLCAATDGALDITIYPVLQAWGFTTDTRRVPDAAELDTLVEKIDYRQVVLQEDLASIPEDFMVDLGAVAKGYTAQVLTGMLKEAGAASALLDLGGNVQAIGENPKGRPWSVAVQHPDGERYLGVLEVSDQAVVTSGGYERNFEQDGKTYHHILDPQTGYPANSGLVSVTVVGQNGLTCDALSTALYVMGTEDALAFWRSRSDFECILLDDEGTLYVTEGLKDCFTPHVENMIIAERG